MIIPRAAVTTNAGFKIGRVLVSTSPLVRSAGFSGNSFGPCAEPLPSAPSFGKNSPCNLVARQKPGQRLVRIEAVVRLGCLSGTKGNERLCGCLWTQYVCDEPRNDCERAEHENNPTCPRKSGLVAYSCAITPAIAQAAAMCSEGNESPPCQVFSIRGRLTIVPGHALTLPLVSYGRSIACGVPAR
jgi:hypothetical protein